MSALYILLARDRSASHIHTHTMGILVEFSSYTLTLLSLPHKNVTANEPFLYFCQNQHVHQQHELITQIG